MTRPPLGWRVHLTCPLLLSRRYNMLMDMQHRDITPEDYDMLSRLDSSQPQTLRRACSTSGTIVVRARGVFAGRGYATATGHVRRSLRPCCGRHRRREPVRAEPQLQ